jgi:hypothetical protein
MRAERAAGLRKFRMTRKKSLFSSPGDGSASPVGTLLIAPHSSIQFFGDLFSAFPLQQGYFCNGVPIP